MIAINTAYHTPALIVSFQKLMSVAAADSSAGTVIPIRYPQKSAFCLAINKIRLTVVPTRSSAKRWLHKLRSMPNKTTCEGQESRKLSNIP
jgi:hypothetical protein